MGSILLSPLSLFESSPSSDVAWSQSVPAQNVKSVPALPTYERVLGPNELSYFLPSRADGVNDMYLHIGFRAPARFVTRERLAIVWAILRLRHPLLASGVEMRPGVYDDVRFVYTPPRSSQEAVDQAKENIEVRADHTKDDLIDAYLNGARTLSDARISYLVVSHSGPEEREPVVPGGFDLRLPEDLIVEHNVLICASHFIGDGMALHATANDFFSLLGGISAGPTSSTSSSATASGEPGATVRTDEELKSILEAEWIERWADSSKHGDACPIPPYAESRLPEAAGKLQAATAKVDYRNSQDHLIGGHTFPRARSTARKTVVPTIPFDAERTKAILKKCKSEGVTISNALFVLCNFAWVRTLEARAQRENRIENAATGRLPIMMYSAINIRPYLSSLPPSSGPFSASYWYLAVGYFNVILSSFIPSHSSPAAIFWHRARAAKAQGSKYMKSKFLISRSQEMAKERGKRAIKFAKEDDGVFEAKVKQPAVVTLPSPPHTPRQSSIERLDGEDIPSPAPPLRALTQSTDEASAEVERKNALLTPPGSPPRSSSDVAPIETVAEPQESPKPKPKAASTPSSALIGLSLLGNLDGTYKHATFPSLQLHTLTTGSRQRQGGMLMFGYTFAGKMWISLGWDVNGFEEGVVEEFWEKVLQGVDEFLA